MNNYEVKKDRAERIREVREEGRQAFLDGKHVNSARQYAEIDRKHWLDGYLGERNRKHLKEAI
jgi:hypothetical protein